MHRTWYVLLFRGLFLRSPGFDSRAPLFVFLFPFPLKRAARTPAPPFPRCPIDEHAYQTSTGIPVVEAEVVEAEVVAVVAVPNAAIHEGIKRVSGRKQHIEQAYCEERQVYSG